MSVQAATDFAASLVKKGHPFGAAVHQAAGRFAIDYSEIQSRLTQRSALARERRLARQLTKATATMAATVVTPKPEVRYFGPPD